MIVLSLSPSAPYPATPHLSLRRIDSKNIPSYFALGIAGRAGLWPPVSIVVHPRIYKHYYRLAGVPRVINKPSQHEPYLWRKWPPLVHTHLSGRQVLNCLGNSKLLSSRPDKSPGLLWSPVSISVLSASDEVFIYFFKVKTSLARFGRRKIYQLAPS